MSDQIKHECGLAFIRLLKPLDYYLDKYGTAFYGLNKLQLLMQKQRNRGQDGAGIATIKLDMEPGKRYISRKRSNSGHYLKDLFTGVYDHFSDLNPDQLTDSEWLKQNRPYMGEVLMGHLRYGTHGANTIESVHPFIRTSNWMSRNLILAGNFNLTNVDILFEQLLSIGQAPKEKSDTVTVLEKIGHFLDEEVDRLVKWYAPDYQKKQDINKLIHKHLDVSHMLTRSCKQFDGGFVMCGMIGHGDAFILRDRNGIRPAYYYQDDEIVVAASERPAIQTAINVKYNKIQEIRRGHALIIKKDGRVSEMPIIEEGKRMSCSFERIYFSRGTDRDIYLERKKLGELLAEQVLDKIQYDLDHTVFSFVPNTAETAFFGLIQGINKTLDQYKLNRIDVAREEGSDIDLQKLITLRPRVEKLIDKDAKLRTFIADEGMRNDMVSHVYDVTYGIVQNDVDTLVLIDDSIVRGTTLRDSIISICARLYPKKIIILSSAPQIRFPDCYGIDMSRMGEFVAFKALVELLKDSGMENMLDETYRACLKENEKPEEEINNVVKDLYAHFAYEEVSHKIAQIVTPKELDIDVEVIFQTLEGLHNSCPQHKGDWYFSGNYPTRGGNKVVNRAFINYMEHKNVRAY